jgi:cholesterol transport system auxiliary component
LLICAPHAAAGYDSPRIVYRQQAHRLESFAHSEWLDTPAHMLVPLLVAALEHSGAFHAVLHTPSSATGDLRLDSEILQLQQEFNNPPDNGQAKSAASHVHFVLRVQLVEEASRRVIAARDFSADSRAPSDDPYGGVIAANQAVQKVLEELAVFCAEAAAGWHPLK